MPHDGEQQYDELDATPKYVFLPARYPNARDRPVQLDVHVKNKGARAFYDKLGFSQCGDMPGMLRLRRRIR